MCLEKWFIRNKQPKEKINYRDLGLDVVSYHILLNRNLQTYDEMKTFLNPSSKSLNSPILFKDMVKAGNVIQSCLFSNKKVRIIGDYDVDGVMSTTILVKGLTHLGFDVDYEIPHRIEDGYGINKRMVDSALEKDIRLIITCDNGISAFEAIDYARSKGMEIIVTDHHEVPTELKKDIKVQKIPNADAVINPKQWDCKYPFKELCGGAIAFQLIRYLYTVLGRSEELDPDFIGFAAMATVCDVMPLVDENRLIVKAGLQQLNDTDNLAIDILRQETGIKGPLDTYHLGFIIGPTINSSGRLTSAEKALEVFLSNNESEIRDNVRELRQLNQQRQLMTEEGVKRIETQLEDPQERKQLVYILKDESIHESIAGIIAGRLKSKYNRPVIIITKGKDGLKGSGRSIENWNMSEEIRKSQDFLTAFGGHPMACGLSLQEDDFLDFKQHVLENLSLTQEDIIPIKRIDYPLSLEDVNFDFIERIEKFAPFGNGNPTPVFGTKNLKIITASLLGKNKNVLKLILKQGKNTFEGILFSEIDQFLNELKSFYGPQCLQNVFNGVENPVNLDILYSPKKNEFRGNINLQIQLKGFRFR